MHGETVKKKLSLYYSKFNWIHSVMLYQYNTITLRL